MPSFDVVSRLNLQEVDNAVNQTKKEISTRYDFQGTKTEINLADDKLSILLKSSSEGRIDAAYEVLAVKLAKRGVSLRGMTREKMELSKLGEAKQTVKLAQGIAIDKARELVKEIKDSKLKIQASIQGDELRVSGKSKDDLQSAISLLKGKQDAMSVDFQFVNFRD